MLSCIFRAAQREGVQGEGGVAQSAPGGDASQGSPGQRSQVHGDVLSTVHLLLHLSRVHLVRGSILQYFGLVLSGRGAKLPMQCSSYVGKRAGCKRNWAQSSARTTKILAQFSSQTTQNLFCGRFMKTWGQICEHFTSIFTTAV